MTSGDVVRNMYEAMRKGDFPAMVGALHPDIEWREAEGNPYQPSGEPWHGPDAVRRELWTRVAKDWERFVVTPERFHEAGATVVVEGRYLAPHRATGRVLDCQFCHVWTVRDGRLASFQQYVDTAQFRDVMGV